MIDRGGECSGQHRVRTAQAKLLGALFAVLLPRNVSGEIESEIRRCSAEDGQDNPSDSWLLRKTRSVLCMNSSGHIFPANILVRKVRQSLPIRLCGLWTW